MVDILSVLSIGVVFAFFLGRGSYKSKLARACITVGVPFLFIAGHQLYTVLTVCGVWVKEVENIGTASCKSLPLAQCEDLHVHRKTGLVFGVCHDLDPEIRYKWFPGIGLFKHPEEGKKARARIHVIDPKTLKHQPVHIENFDHSFVSHGFDIWQDSETVYLHAVNHPPNPDYTEDDSINPLNGRFDFSARSERKIHKARDQIEVFKIAMPASGMPTKAEHIRSVRHSLLVEANDLVSTGPDSFYVTNDRFYLDGHLRDIEGILTTKAPWSNIIHMTASSKETNAEAGVQAHIALDKVPYANGLGRGPGAELVCCSAQAGILFRLEEDIAQRKLKIIETHYGTTTNDNPFYLDTGSKRTSAYYISGLTKALDLAAMAENSTAISGSNVYRVRIDAESDRMLPDELIFQDDGRLLKTGSIAVVVPSSDTTGDMVVSGPWSDNLVVCPITL